MHNTQNSLEDLSNILANLRMLSNQQLDVELRRETRSERELLSKIVCYIYEVDRRKLYLKYNYTSLFDYLVKEMKYSSASAQRRLDAARLIEHAPELASNLASGELTLNQVSIVAQGLKQARREAASNGERFTSTSEVKRDLLEKVKSQPKEKAQQLVADTLNLEVKAIEKKVYQRDESLRLEITFSKEEAALLNEVRNLLSHSMPGASYKDVLVGSLREIVRRRDPAKTARASKEAKEAELTSAVEVKKSAAEVRRSVFRNDKCCQWVYPDQKICGSTFQLQIDHKKSRWLGGTEEEANLQLLCSAHNRLKYQQEIGLS